MYTCIAVDDQAESLRMIKEHIENTEQLELKLATQKAIEALNFIDSFKPDIIFLDVEMPGMTGIEFIEILQAKWSTDMPKVVFITGFNKYALQGYEFGAVDYIMKPATYSRFKKSVDRIIADLEKQKPAVEDEEPDFFFADSDGKRVRIENDDIIHVQGARDYIIVVTHEKKHILHRSMRAMREVLPEKDFVRIHKSHIVAIKKIQSILGNQLIVKVKDNEVSLPIGITYRSSVMKRLRVV